MSNCPVCQIEVRKTENRYERVFYECPRCGPYSLSYEASHDIGGWITRYENGATLLSHAIYKMTHGRHDWPMLSNQLIENILETTELPSALEQLDNLIIWFGAKQGSPGRTVEITDETIAAIGALDDIGAGTIVEFALELHWVDGLVNQMLDGGYAYGPLKLTLEGWRVYHELKRNKANSNQAFMAMKFGEADTDSLFRDHFKDAVGKTGFNLKRLDDEPKAGLIDDRLRVEIRQSRFLIADLTHHNPGAYWEAGFAEGLGKPVIYTCRKDVFDNPATKPHFDTNHHLTVVWDMANIQAAFGQPEGNYQSHIAR